MPPPLVKQRLLFDDAPPDYGILGCSRQIQSVLRTIRKLSHDNSPVLITGESGVGKELVARALHEVSLLATDRLLAVDSASLVGSLMESELFGHVKGAFTGAIGNKTGLVRAAEGGTLFLDEIGELTIDLQAKLLRLLQEREVRPIGSTRVEKVNVRILAATNRDLLEEVEHGRFRKDLYYRLNVIRIHVPPLRERPADIPLLARHFVETHAVHSVTFSEGVMKRFMQYSWPGNVRELENAIRRMVVLKSDSVLKLQDLPSNLKPPDEQAGSQQNGSVARLHEVERRHILQVLEQTRGDIQEAADLLGIGRTTLYRKLKQYRGENSGSPQGSMFT